MREQLKKPLGKTSLIREDECEREAAWGWFDAIRGEESEESEMPKVNKWEAETDADGKDWTIPEAAERPSLEFNLPRLCGT